MLVLNDCTIKKFRVASRYFYLVLVTYVCNSARKLSISCVLYDFFLSYFMLMTWLVYDIFFSTV